MLTTISIPDRLYKEIQELAEGQPFNDFVREAIQAHVLHLRKGKLAQEVAEGYRAEMATSSLDPEWKSFEVEGLA